MFSNNDQRFIMENVGDCWSKLAGKHIFITGGTGFIGKWITGALLTANKFYDLRCKITILTRNANTFHKSNKFISNDPAVDFIDGDVRLLSFFGKSYDIIIHAATDVSNKNHPIDTFNVCVKGTQSVLDFALKSNASNFLLLSSGAVYGRQPPELNSMSESFNGIPSRTNEQSAYGLGKISAEWLVSEYSRSYNLNAKIARCFAFVGPYIPMDKHFAIGNFIRDAIKGNPILINGDGSQVRTYLYSAELSVWLLKILLDGKSGDIFNVGGEKEISIGGLAKLIGILINKKVPIITKKKINGTLPPEKYVPNINLIKEKLGLYPKISLENSIDCTAKWLIKRGTF